MDIFLKKGTAGYNQHLIAVGTLTQDISPIDNNNLLNQNITFSQNKCRFAKEESRARVELTLGEFDAVNQALRLFHKPPYPPSSHIQACMREIENAFGGKANDWKVVKR